MTKPPAKHSLSRLRGSARLGRLRARVPRYVLLAFLIVMCLAGIRATLIPQGSSGPAVVGAARADYAAQNFAASFARAYLTYDGADLAAREQALARFVPTSLDFDAGFIPPDVGSQRVTWTDIAQVQRPLIGGTIITVAVGISARTDPVYLSVPVVRGSEDAISLGGYPAFVGPPLTANPDLGSRDLVGVEDGDISTLVSRALTNYLAGDAENLAADLAEAATVTLPTTQFELGGVEELDWVNGPGSGAVLATVTAADESGGTYTLRYEVGIRRVEGDPQIAPGWRVSYIQTISQET